MSPELRIDLAEPADPRRRGLLLAGAGWFTLPLLTACGGGTNLAASPNTGSARLPQSPRGLHASWTEDTRSTRTLTWFTDGPALADSFIEYGPVTPDMDAQAIVDAPLPHRAAATQHALFGVDGLAHIATARNLSPSLPLRYRVGSAKAWSAVHVLPATPADTIRFIHFGDHAQTEFSRALVDSVLTRKPDFTIIAGDLAYANGEQPLWDSYFDMLEPLAARIPIMTCPGNHEAKDGGGAAYRSRFAQPGEGVHYSFDYGRLHFCVSTGGSLLVEGDTSDALATELLAVEADLAQAALRRAGGEIDFIIFVQHFTIWTDDKGRDPNNDTLVRLEEGILLRYGVDLLLVGHDHIYERSKPMGRGKPLQGGYVQVTQGGGGRSLYELVPVHAEWSDIATLRYGFTEYDIDGRTIRGTSYAIDDENNQLLERGQRKVIDTFEIRARDSLAAKAYAVPPRGKNAVLQNIDAVVHHTVRRNQLHDAAEQLVSRAQVTSV